jgi:hypothetical protein
MTFAEFKRKWGRSKAKETASYQEHFVDLCRLLGQPTPVEADPAAAISSVSRNEWSRTRNFFN